MFLKNKTGGKMMKNTTRKAIVDEIKIILERLTKKAEPRINKIKNDGEQLARKDQLGIETIGDLSRIAKEYFKIRTDQAPQETKKLADLYRAIIDSIIDIEDSLALLPEIISELQETPSEGMLEIINKALKLMDNTDAEMLPKEETVRTQKLIQTIASNFREIKMLIDKISVIREIVRQARGKKIGDTANRQEIVIKSSALNQEAINQLVAAITQNNSADNIQRMIETLESSVKHQLQEMQKPTGQLAELMAGNSIGLGEKLRKLPKNVIGYILQNKAFDFSPTSIQLLVLISILNKKQLEKMVSYKNQRSNNTDENQDNTQATKTPIVKSIINVPGEFLIQKRLREEKGFEILKNEQLIFNELAIKSEFNKIKMPPANYIRSLFLDLPQLQAALNLLKALGKTEGHGSENLDELGQPIEV